MHPRQSYWQTQLSELNLNGEFIQLDGNGVGAQWVSGAELNTDVQLTPLCTACTSSATPEPLTSALCGGALLVFGLGLAAFRKRSANK